MKEFRVICIDSKPRRERLANFYLKFLFETETYTVTGELNGGWQLKEVPAHPEYPDDTQPSFNKNRFVVLSSIPEADVVNQESKEAIVNLETPVL